jgi:hypothetical protein
MTSLVAVVTILLSSPYNVLDVDSLLSYSQWYLKIICKSFIGDWSHNSYLATAASTLSMYLVGFQCYVRLRKVDVRLDWVGEIRLDLISIFSNSILCSENDSKVFIIFLIVTNTFGFTCQKINMENSKSKSVTITLSINDLNFSVVGSIVYFFRVHHYVQCSQIVTIL